MPSIVERVLFTTATLSPLIHVCPECPHWRLLGDRIVAWGSDDDMLALAGAETVRDDLAGNIGNPWPDRCPYSLGDGPPRNCSGSDIFEVPSKQIALERVAERVALMLFRSMDSWLGLVTGFLA